MAHHPDASRHLTDLDLATRSVEWLYDLAGDCETEPAEPSVCDSCAAYIIAQEKENPDQDISDELLQVIREANPGTVAMLRTWLKLGKNAASLNRAPDQLSEWAKGWNAAHSQLHV